MATDSPHPDEHGHYELYSISKEHGLDPAGVVTVLVNMDQDNRRHVLDLLCQELGPYDLIRALENNGWQLK